MNCLPDGERDQCGVAFTDQGEMIYEKAEPWKHTYFINREKLAAKTLRNYSVVVPRTARVAENGKTHDVPK